MPPFNINNKLADWRSFGNGAAKGSPFLLLYMPEVVIRRGYKLPIGFYPPPNILYNNLL
jgi:hypothetical protein